MNKIYFDNAATTPVRPQVVTAMTDILANHYGNPSSLHATGRDARALIDKAREQVASLLNAPARQIFFTSCGTESINWSVLSTTLHFGSGHLVTTQVEHHAGLHAFARAQKMGFEITYIAPDTNGMISADAVIQSLRPDTRLVSVMMANNEVGTIMPIAEISNICNQAGVWLHVDAVQAAGHIPIDVMALGVDMLSISGHKFGAPKGVGALYIKNGLPLKGFLLGGAQESNLRAGTENTAGIVGIGLAAEIAQSELESDARQHTIWRDQIISRMLEIPQTIVTGHPTIRLPGVASFCFPNIDSESILMLLDLQGIAASGGSACSAGACEASHVLTAMGLTHNESRGAVRISIGHDNTQEEMNVLLEKFPEIILKLRAMSPLV